MGIPEPPFSASLNALSFLNCPVDPPSPKGSGATSGDENNPSTGLRAGKKWVLMGADGGYLIGDFDGKTFTSDSGPIKSYEEGKNALKRCIDGEGFFPKGRKRSMPASVSATPLTAASSILAGPA
jgi:hypothetical protein